MSDLIESVTKGRWKTRYLMSQFGDIVQKECRKCREMKVLDEFYPAKDCLALRRSECKDCELSANRHYHKSDRKRSAARKHLWRSANRDKSVATVRAWYQANRDSINARRRESGSGVISNKLRRERISNLENNWSESEREATLKYFGGCALTGNTEHVQFDHVIPIVTGYGGTVAWNMLPMTAELNQSKSTKHIIVWFYENQERFSLSEDRFLRALEYLADLRNTDINCFLEYIDACHENTKQGEK